MIAQQFIQFIFIGPSGVAYEIGSFHFVCLGIFLELYHNFFLNFGMGAWNPYGVVQDRVRLSGKNPLHPNCENGPKVGQKQGFLNLWNSLVIRFYWICYIMKIYISCVPAQIPYLGKFYSWDMSQKVLNQSDCRIFNQPHLQNKSMK